MYLFSDITSYTEATDVPPGQRLQVARDVSDMACTSVSDMACTTSQLPSDSDKDIESVRMHVASM